MFDLVAMVSSGLVVVVIIIVVVVVVVVVIDLVCSLHLTVDRLRQ